jgi:uridine phosphorylase
VGRGQLRGVAVGVCSTGIGGPSTEIALVELARLGVSTVIRIGGMGALHARLEPGSFAVVRHAVREGGAARYYLPPDKDAVADSTVCAALLAAASCSGRRYQEITVLSTDSYYLGQGRALAGMEEMAEQRLRHVRELAVDGMDMEAETVLAIGAALGLAAGVLLVVHGNRATDAWLEDYQDTQLALIRVASEAATQLQGRAGR